MTIHDLASKIKSFLISPLGNDILIGLVVLVTAIGAFGLGKLSVIEKKEPLIIFDNGIDIVPISQVVGTVSSGQPPSLTTGVNADNGSFVASKNGTKYYPVNCSAVNRIKDENKVFFDTALAAENAGFTVSTACK